MKQLKYLGKKSSYSQDKNNKFYFSNFQWHRRYNQVTDLMCQEDGRGQVKNKCRQPKFDAWRRTEIRTIRTLVRTANFADVQDVQRRRIENVHIKMLCKYQTAGITNTFW